MIIASFYRRWGKRWFDILVASLLLIVLAPLMAAIALYVRARLGSPVLFRQQRPGRGGQPFTILKFRTMREAYGAGGKPLVDAERLTKAGRLLRATSLDELPELWNVLVGDMSLVGPRPLLMRYLPRYTEAQQRRHLVRPGITGLAQVRGRNAISWDAKFTYDIDYVERYGFGLDLVILVRTVLSVLRRDGIDAGKRVTMPEFWGTAAPSGLETERVGRS